MDRRAQTAAISSAIRVAGAEEAAPLIERLIEDIAAPESLGERMLACVRRCARALRIKTLSADGRDCAPVVAVWDLLSPDLRRVVLATGHESVLDAAARCSTHASAPARRAAVLALHDLASSESFSLLIPVLLDEDAAVAGAADRALLALAERWSADPANAPDLNAVGASLIEAMRAVGDERLSGPHTAVLALATPRFTSPASAEVIPAISAWLQDPGEHVTGIARVLRASRTAESRLRAWQWLRRKPFAAACVDRLDRSVEAGDHEIVLAAAHLSVNPRRAAAARAVGRSAWSHRSSPRVSGGEVGSSSIPSIRSSAPVPKPEVVPDLSSRAKWGLARWVHLISAPAPIRQAVLAPLLVDPAAGVRLSGARAAAAEDLADYCFDEDRAVARTAMNRWSLLGADLRGRTKARASDQLARVRLLTRLTRSPHAAVRHMAQADLLRLDPATHLAGPDAAIAASSWMAADPASIQPTVERLLESTDPRLAAAASRTAQRAGLCAVVQDRLAGRFERCTASDRSIDPAWADRLAATLVVAMSEVPSSERTEACSRALAAALDHPDARVRSNAVDGIARHARRSHGSSTVGVLIDLKNDAHHRVRGSALRGLMWLADPADQAAFGAMLQMLDDSRPSHRLAATWLAERWIESGNAGPDELQTAIEKLQCVAESDDDVRVAARARRAQRRARLLAGLEGLDPMVEHAA